MTIGNNYEPSIVFVQLVETDVPEKGEVLLKTLEALSAGRWAEELYVRSPSRFGSISESPLAYWASDAELSVFESHESLESETRWVRKGLDTSDDFRFLRLWWEPKAEGLLDIGQIARTHGDSTALKKLAHEMTRHGRGWVPHAKGGDFSPYYADLSLVLNWNNDGAEMREKARQVNGTESRSIRSPSVYFLPGVTWTQRTLSGLNARALPAGVIHGTKGSSLFSASKIELGICLALMNSEIGRRFVDMLTCVGSYGEGVIKRLPFPSEAIDDAISELALEQVFQLQKLDRSNETSHAFSLDTSSSPETGSSGSEPLKRGIRDRIKMIESGLLQAFSLEETPYSSSEVEASWLDIPVPIDVSRWVSIAFGRWDVRIAKDQSLAPNLQGPFDPLPVCAPATLVGPDGLPARSGGIASEAWLRARPDAITLPPEGSFAGAATIADEAYPLPVPWDGLLIDDVDEPDHADGLLTRVRAALAVLHGDEAPEVERQLAQGVGARSLADYLRRPGGFFADHLARYSKSRRQAPIYWPLSTPSGSFTVWVYYPRLTSDTLYRIDNQYLERKFESLDREIEKAARELPALSGKQATQQREQLEERTARREELLAFRQELLRVAGLPYRPDHDDGVILCAAPLWRLFRLSKWARATREAWEKLERGDYDWAHLAMAIWPERVLEKCRTDRSLAIAHDREDRYVAPPPGAAKKGKRAAALPLTDDEEEDA